MSGFFLIKLVTQQYLKTLSWWSLLCCEGSLSWCSNILWSDLLFWLEEKLTQSVDVFSQEGWTEGALLKTWRCVLCFPFIKWSGISLNQEVCEGPTLGCWIWSCVTSKRVGCPWQGELCLCAASNHQACGLCVPRWLGSYQDAVMYVKAEWAEECLTGCHDIALNNVVISFWILKSWGNMDVV